MPERIAVKRIILGGGKKEDRRDIMPGQIVNLTNEQAAELDAKGMVRKRGDAEREARMAERADRSALERVAQPEAGEADKSGVAARTNGNGNTTREPLAAGAGENDDL